MKTHRKHIHHQFHHKTHKKPKRYYHLTGGNNISLPPTALDYAKTGLTNVGHTIGQTFAQYPILSTLATAGVGYLGYTYGKNKYLSFYEKSITDTATQNQKELKEFINLYDKCGEIIKKNDKLNAAIPKVSTTNPIFTTKVLEFNNQQQIITEFNKNGDTTSTPVNYIDILVDELINLFKFVIYMQCLLNQIKKHEIEITYYDIYNSIDKYIEFINYINNYIYEKCEIIRKFISQFNDINDANRNTINTLTAIYNEYQVKSNISSQATEENPTLDQIQSQNQNKLKELSILNKTFNSQKEQLENVKFYFNQLQTNFKDELNVEELCKHVNDHIIITSVLNDYNFNFDILNRITRVAQPTDITAQINKIKKDAKKEAEKEIHEKTKNRNENLPKYTGVIKIK